MNRTHCFFMLHKTVNGINLTHLNKKTFTEAPNKLAKMKVHARMCLPCVCARVGLVAFVMTIACLWTVDCSVVSFAGNPTPIAKKSLTPSILGKYDACSPTSTAPPFMLRKYFSMAPATVKLPPWWCGSQSGHSFGSACFSKITEKSTPLLSHPCTWSFPVPSVIIFFYSLIALGKRTAAGKANHATYPIKRLNIL